jgi:large subunit ribosomal protein L32
MAVPKKKMSRSRTRRRKAQWRVPMPTTVACDRCARPHRPHRACPHCGTYNGREVLEPSQP